MSNASNHETHPTGFEWGEADPESADAPDRVYQRMWTIYVNCITYTVIHLICQTHSTAKPTQRVSRVERGEAEPEEVDAPDGIDERILKVYMVCMIWRVIYMNCMFGRIIYMICMIWRVIYMIRMIGSHLYDLHDLESDLHYLHDLEKVFYLICMIWRVIYLICVE